MEFFNKTKWQTVTKCAVLFVLSLWVCVFLLQQSESRKAAVASAVNSKKVRKREEEHSLLKFLALVSSI